MYVVCQVKNNTIYGSGRLYYYWEDYRSELRADDEFWLKNQEKQRHRRI
jgi:hypothetical protein